MDLVEVDVIGAEAPQAVFDGGKQGFARQAAGVGGAAPVEERLGGNDHLVAQGEVLEGAAGELLGCAGGIGVGGVEEIYSCFKGLAEEGAAGLFVECPFMHAFAGRAEAHAAKADARDREAGAAEIAVFHGSTPLFG